MSDTALLASIETLNRSVGEYRARMDAFEGKLTADTKESLDTQAAAIADLIEQVRSLSAIRPNIHDPANEVEALERRAFEKLIRYGIGGTQSTRANWTEEERQVISGMWQKRGLSGQTDATGGFLVAPQIERQILSAALNIAAIRPNADVATISSSSFVHNSMTNPTMSRIIEGGTKTDQNLTIGQKESKITELYGLVKISRNLMEDSAYDIWGQIISRFGKAIASAEDTEWVSGNGVTAPEGILTNTTVLANYTASGVAAAISDATHNGIDALTTMMGALNAAYQQNAKFAMSSVTQAVLLNLKNGDGDYLWKPMVEAGKPATLHGKPVILPESMPAIAAGTYPIIYGDFREGYSIRDRAGMTIQRLEEKYADEGKVGLIVTVRNGGGVRLAEAFRVLKIAAS